MILDRNYQRELLERMAESYPLEWDCRTLMRSWGEADQKRFIANAKYLEEHGLAKVPIDANLQGISLVGLPRITAKGLDFLADDGGLSAILGIVTIKLHDETLTRLIQAHIDQLPDGEEDKAPLRRAFATLSSAALESIAGRLVGLGVSALPQTAHELHTWLLAVAR